ncbi:MAG: ABC transporter substrate-binding protein [Elusimicrobia bacterium]|nr:ABC transporter substrate-binding protein [Elusimicrobiota bacterium]
MIRAFPALLALCLFTAPASAARSKNPDTLTRLGLSDADSLDPAWSYDTFSHEVIANVYDYLFMFEGGSVEKLIPLAAAKVPSRANGLISADGKTYTIPIRAGMVFHDGTPVTAEDVRYSILRFMLFDRDAGPSSLLLQPLVDRDSTRDSTGKIDPKVFADAAKAVQVDGDKVVLRLPKPFAPMLTVLASWAPVVSRKWVAEKGGWDGAEATWQKFNNPSKTSSPLHEAVMGTGPFKLERWDRNNKQIVLVRNDRYWRTPAKLKRVVIKAVSEFGTRKLMLQAGDADTITADRPVFSQLQNVPGVELIDDQQMLDMNPVAFFTFKIKETGNPYIGSGKLDGEGVPPDFFSDLDLRRAFAYSFDYKGFIKDVMRGKGTQATGCIPNTLPGHNPKQATYSLDLKKAEEHFRKARGGEVWEKGFRFTLSYNTGNVARETLCQILKRQVESINPKFKIDVRPLEWPTFLDAYKGSKLPVFIIGWNADFPDAHTFVFPMLHSRGDYPFTQRFKDERIDKLIDQALDETDLAKRKDLYAKVQALEYELVPHLVILDTVRFRTQRDWVKGWYHNPIFPDAPYGAYYYPIWKE